MRRLRSSLLVVIALAAAGCTSATSWEETIDRVSRSVVVLRVSVPRAFDTDLPAFERATGFVVDAERGLILTNRHVVKPGPAVTEAVFLDHEEVPVRAVYRDPVHDFGFYRYDPDEVEFMQPVALLLEPEKARVGTEIRVVGNDAGEKLSILAGTLARLDRRAPFYGRGRYNDFNTFYYQAASGTSGGSSGSPVVDIHGDAVALNAGGSRRSSSSFYLPLDPVKRALAYVQRGAPVPRGTLQAVFVHHSYDELRRLALRSETEALVRRTAPDETGMLVVKEIIPGGPADGVLEVGDVLVRLEGELITQFSPLEFGLDALVGREARLSVERGGEPLDLALRVQDLHEITPSSYLEMGGGVLHPLSYQQARNFAVPLRGLHLVAPGYMFHRAGIPSDAVVTAADGVPIASIDDFEERVSRLPDGARLPLRFFRLEEPNNEVVELATVDRRWFPMQRCERGGASGRWPCTPSPAPPKVKVSKPASTTFDTSGTRPARDLASSLVMVEFDAPFRIDGIPGARFQGAGLVVDAERGLVVVDRETAPTTLGDLRLTFAASVDVPGEVVYLHPLHNLAVVAYDPALLGDTPVKSATLVSAPLSPGDRVWLVGLNARLDVVSRESRVSRVYSPRLPLSSPPRFRETNMELIGLADQVTTVGGVLADDEGRVHAFWSAFSTPGKEVQLDSFFAGIGAGYIADMVDPLRAGKDPSLRGLEVEFSQITLAEARRRGLSENAARGFELHENGRRRVLSVARLRAGTPAAEAFRAGDLLLKVNGRPAISFHAVERAARAERVTVRVLRNREEVEFEVATTALPGAGTDRCVTWAGAMLQSPHRALSAQHGIEPGGIYVSWLWYGSPANRDGLRATRRIVEVDGIPTPELDAFLAAVADRPDRSTVRLRTLDLDGKERVLTLVLDLEFWPTAEFRRVGRQWERISLSKPAG